MTITFDQYLEAIEYLPRPGSTNVPVFKVVLRSTLPPLLYSTEHEPPATIPVLTFVIHTMINKNGRRVFYWKPQATIVPELCSE